MPKANLDSFEFIANHHSNNFFSLLGGFLFSIESFFFYIFYDSDYVDILCFNMVVFMLPMIVLMGQLLGDLLVREFIKAVIFFPKPYIGVATAFDSGQFQPFEVVAFIDFEEFLFSCCHLIDQVEPQHISIHINKAEVEERQVTALLSILAFFDGHFASQKPSDEKPFKPIHHLATSQRLVRIPFLNALAD